MMSDPADDDEWIEDAGALAELELLVDGDPASPLELELVAPAGQSPLAVRAWYDTLATAKHVESDGTLAAAQNSARAYRARAKADNTRAAYRSAVRAWCLWCDRHGCTPLPASSADVAAFTVSGITRHHTAHPQT